VRFYHRHGFREIVRTDGSHNEEHEPDIQMKWTPERRRFRLTRPCRDADRSTR
jgi:hypothetical protein